MDAINGYNNHSDFQDIHFNFNQGWILRKPHQFITIPTFTWYESLDVTYIYIIKWKGRKVNHWTKDGEYMLLMDHRNTAGTRSARYQIWKWAYGQDYVGLFEVTNWGSWWTCTFTFNQANQLGETPETAWSYHSSRPSHYRTRLDFRYSCNLSPLTNWNSGTIGYYNL